MTSTPLPRLQVFIAHAEHLIAAGVTYAFEREAGVELLRNDSTEACTRARADVIVTDYVDGMRLAAELRSRGHAPQHACRLMVVTNHDREYEVRQAMEAGIHGYVLASCHTDELVRCVRALGMGSRYISLAVAQRMADSMSREALTAREVDVLRLLVRGQCNKSIANSLDIAVGTVKAHVKAIMGKLDARSRTHAVTVAAERGLVKEVGEWSGMSPTFERGVDRRLMTPDPLAA